MFQEVWGQTGVTSAILGWPQCLPRSEVGLSPSAMKRRNWGQWNLVTMTTTESKSQRWAGSVKADGTQVRLAGTHWDSSHSLMWFEDCRRLPHAPVQGSQQLQVLPDSVSICCWGLPPAAGLPPVTNLTCMRAGHHTPLQRPSQDTPLHCPLWCCGVGSTRQDRPGVSDPRTLRTWRASNCSCSLIYTPPPLGRSPISFAQGLQTEI